ncbi:hypothetical protein C1646_756166 [Rhizophagus diaphanus]|nr:hypothetical protein C1646_756166 [Rhizophagus diaphanus] [Rhizophagus sp. MUCL 43196]
MSVATEGEEISVSRETRQASKINQIFTIIDDSLTQMRDQNIIKINITEPDKIDDRIREAIHNKYKAEIIDKDIFIKVDGGLETTIHVDLVFAARTHNPAWFVAPTTCCVVGPNSYEPDVGIWFIKPTFLQLEHPIVNLCPPPDVWIKHALNNINTIPQINPAIEFVGIALPDLIRSYRQNPTPGVASVHVTPENDQTTRPTHAPLERASGPPMWVEATTEYCSGRNFSALNDFIIHDMNYQYYICDDKKIVDKK